MVRTILHQLYNSRKVDIINIHTELREAFKISQKIIYGAHYYTSFFYKFGELPEKSRILLCTTNRSDYIIERMTIAYERQWIRYGKTLDQEN